MKDEEWRNWAELPLELMSSIMLRLGAIDILQNVQKVCTSWRRVTKDPSMWRKIDMHYDGDLESLTYDLEILCCHAVDLSQGGLVEIDLWHFGSDDLLNYIADSASNLRRLRFEMCSQIMGNGVARAVMKLPFLEELDVSYCSYPGEFLRDVGQSCPNLKTLKLIIGSNDCALLCSELIDSNATYIAESMPELRHLQLVGDVLTNTGLNAILDGCPHLEHLDLRNCHNINLVGDLEKRCSERIRVLKHPNDSTDDFPFEMGSFNDFDYLDESLEEITLYFQSPLDDWDSFADLVKFNGV